MHHALLLLLLVAAPPGYEDILREARALFLDTTNGRTMEVRLNEEYRKLAEACRLDDSRWEAFYERGANRAKRAFFAHNEAEDFLSLARARGASPREAAAIQAGADTFIRTCLAEAHANYSKAFERMRRAGYVDPDRKLLANATLKFAAREYLEAKHGQPGAIEDFKRLLARDFDETFCRDHIALSYLDLGYMAYADEKTREAHRYWNTALGWTASPWLRDLVLTNKAGAFEMDNEFGRAEEVLRQQIEREPNQAAHWKNLGLVVGYQNRLKEALYYYARARDICLRTRSAEFFGKWHGNAWLRAAVIHGKLLETDGDLDTAWRLFLEYRRMFGDDYNFSVWFADFAASLGRYDLAWRYYEHASALRPDCEVPRLGLVEIAPRLRGSREDVDARIEEATAALEKVRARVQLHGQTTAVKRICAGMRDRADGGRLPAAEEIVFLDPDPLAGTAVDAPPAWVREEAALRDPFTPWEPRSGTGTGAPGSAPETAAEEPGGGATVGLVGLGVVAVLGLVIGLLLFGRRG